MTNNTALLTSEVMTTAKDIAATILSQLGGTRFALMTGAKNFEFGESKDGAYLHFSLPRTAHFVKDGINAVRITLLPSDTYHMSFRRYHTAAELSRQIQKHGAASVKGYDEKETITGAYAEDLRRTFTEVTGLETSLGRLAA